VVWAGLILVGTSWPSISVGPDVIIGFDKVVHFGMYGILAVLVMRALRPPYSISQSVAVLLALAAFGAADEWHQAFIPGRSESIWDWIADTLGVITGLVASRYNLPASAEPDGSGPSDSVHRDTAP
jgi:VanZ family protein